MGNRELRKALRFLWTSATFVILSLHEDCFVWISGALILRAVSREGVLGKDDEVTLGERGTGGWSPRLDSGAA